MKSDIKKLVVFPTDPLIIYKNKGEIKERYFNPENFFDEIHVIDVSAHELSDNDKKELSNLAGDKKLFVHYFHSDGKISSMLLKKVILEKVREIHPDCIRAYGVFIEGYLASYCAKKLDIPFVLSVHGNYNHHKYLVMRKENFFLGLFHWTFILLYLRRIVKQASEVIYVYKQALGTTKNFTEKNHQHIIYNKVFFKHAYTKDIYSPKRHKIFTMIYIGNFYKVKNQKFLLEVIKPLDVKLILVGKGHTRKPLMKYVEETPELKDKVTFVEAVTNKDLPKYYAMADCLISATFIQEIGIPVIEAMACGLPILHRKPFKGENVDPVFDAMYLIDFNVEAFRKAIICFKENPELLEEYSKRSVDVFETISGDKMEAKEEKVYETLLKD